MRRGRSNRGRPADPGGITPSEAAAAGGRARPEQLAVLKQKVESMQEELQDVRRRLDELHPQPAAGTGRYAVVDRLKCTGCRRCEDVCPVGAIHVTYVAQINRALCVGCGACTQACPNEAIRLAQSA